MFHAILCLVTRHPSTRIPFALSPAAHTRRPTLRLVAADAAPPHTDPPARQARWFAAAVVERATGVRIDVDAAWTVESLRSLGCSDELAGELADVFREPPPASVAPAAGPDLMATVAIASTAIAGLSPIGDGVPDDPPVGRRGWRRPGPRGPWRRRRDRAIPSPASRRAPDVGIALDATSTQRDDASRLR